MSGSPSTVRERRRGPLSWIAMWRKRAEDRRALAAMDGRMLADLGISRARAEAEACKPFWRR